MPFLSTYIPSTTLFFFVAPPTIFVAWSPCLQERHLGQPLLFCFFNQVLKLKPKSPIVSSQILFFLFFENSLFVIPSYYVLLLKNEMHWMSSLTQSLSLYLIIIILNMITQSPSNILMQVSSHCSADSYIVMIFNLRNSSHRCRIPITFVSFFPLALSLLQPSSTPLHSFRDHRNNEKIINKWLC